MAFIYSNISMPGGQFSHFRDKMSLARVTGHRWSILGRSRPFRDSWQAYSSQSLGQPITWQVLTTKPECLWDIYTATTQMQNSPSSLMPGFITAG